MEWSDISINYGGTKEPCKQNTTKSAFRILSQQLSTMLEKY